MFRKTKEMQQVRGDVDEMAPSRGRRFTSLK
jgi:hypothetical protein